MVTEKKELYRDLSGHLALELVNTVDRTRGGPWIEMLEDYGDLVTWAEQGGLLAPTRARGLRRRKGERRAAKVLSRARDLREAVYRILMERLGEEPARGDELAVLDTELERALPHRRLVRRGDDFAWEWEDDPGALDAPLWPVAHALGELLVCEPRERLRLCASQTCLWIFLDTTRNGRRRWCDMSVCGNRAKVCAYRHRCREDE